jgi:hypothetical protein
MYRFKKKDNEMKTKELNINHLYYFYLTVKHGSMVNGARYLGISQPTMSSQLKVFQESMEVKLFHLDNRKSLPTKLGLEIFTICESIFENIDDIKILMDESRGKMQEAIYKTIHVPENGLFKDQHGREIIIGDRVQ